MRKWRAGHSVMLAGAVLLLAALLLAVYNWQESRKGGERSEKIRNVLESVLEEESESPSVVGDTPIITTRMTIPRNQTMTVTKSNSDAVAGNGNSEDAGVLSEQDSVGASVNDSQGNSGISGSASNGISNGITTTTRPIIADAWDSYQTYGTDPLTGLPLSNSEEQEEVWCEVEDNWYIGILTIPVLGVEVPIYWEYVYEQLPYTPCRYAGSYLTDDMVIAAHNYDSHFGRIRQLDSGDEVNFTDMTGTVYHYQVIQTETLPDTATEEMLEGDWDLTLFTCTLGGVSRVTVRCERIS